MARRAVVATILLIALAAAATAEAAVFGKTQTLTGLTPAEKMAIRPYKVARFNASLPAPTGKLWVGVWLQMKNVGKKGYSDSPLTGAWLVTKSKKKITGSISIGGACKNPSTLKIAVGKSVNTCIAFEVPKSAKLSTFGFALDAGFANQKGTWTHVPAF